MTEDQIEEPLSKVVYSDGNINVVKVLYEHRLGNRMKECYLITPATDVHITVIPKG